MDLAVWLATSGSPTRLPLSGSGQIGTSAVQVWTLIVAGLAVLATILSAWWLRRTGKGTVRAAERAAEASALSAKAAQDSADASTRSAKAAEDSVALNATVSTADGRRADAAALAQRYEQAAAQLGHGGAAVRLAGVYAMARLADDWAEQRQTCVDVLCAYLRLPQDPDPRQDHAVRQTITSLIEVHTSVAGGGCVEHAWTALDFNLDDATFDDLHWADMRFDGRLSMRGCTFAGDADFLRLEMRQEWDLAGSTFGRKTVISGLTAHDGTSLRHVHIGMLGSIDFHAGYLAGAASFADSIVDGSLVVRVTRQRPPGGLIAIRGARFGARAVLDLRSPGGLANAHEHGQILEVDTCSFAETATASVEEGLFRSGLLQWTGRRKPTVVGAIDDHT